MKNCSCLIFCLLILPFLGFAQGNYNAQQNSHKGNIELGFTVAPNIGWMRVTNSQEANVVSNGARAGISYGVIGDFGFDRNYFFSTGFTVTSVNANTKESYVQTALYLSATNKIVYKLQYIEIPLTLKLKTNPTDLGRFYGQFGLGTGIKISGKETINGGGNITADNANIFRASLIVGAGAEWKLNPGISLQTGLTLNRGLTNAISNSYGIRNDYLALNLIAFF